MREGEEGTRSANAHRISLISETPARHFEKMVRRVGSIIFELATERRSDGRRMQRWDVYLVFFLLFLTNQY
jgi:hypothetical protein